MSAAGSGEKKDSSCSLLENPKDDRWGSEFAGPRAGSTAACWGSETGRNSRKEPRKADCLVTGSVEGG